MLMNSDCFLRRYYRYYVCITGGIGVTERLEALEEVVRDTIDVAVEDGPVACSMSD